MILNRDVVVEGIIRFTLEAKITLRDAVTLYQLGRYSSSVILATLALENLGQSFWLIALENDSERMSTLTPRSFGQELATRNQVKKLRQGLVAYQATTRDNVPDLSTLDVESSAFEETAKAIFDRFEEMRKQESATLQISREKAQYPKLSKLLEWQASSAILKADAYKIILHASNNYRCSQFFYLHRINGLDVVARNIGLYDDLFEDTAGWSHLDTLETASK
jgi:AbiV family abortive infection protein